MIVAEGSAMTEGKKQKSDWKEYNAQLVKAG